MTDSSLQPNDVDVAGHACEIFEPARPSEHGFVVIYLHGVHQNRFADLTGLATECERHGLRVIAPRGGACWWTDRICEEFDSTISTEKYILERVVPYIAERWGTRPGQMGTSMGGQGALRLAFKHARTFPIVAALAPAIDYQIRFREGDEILQRMYRDAEQVRQDTATLYVHPLNWPRNMWFACDPTDRWHESVDRLQMKLSSIGIPHEHDLETIAGGHGPAYYNAMAPKAVGFLAAALERERMRVN